MAGSESAEASFTRVYAEQADRVYAYLCTRLQNSSLAEELTGQVFLEAWRQRERVVIDPAVGWAPWLFGVARNLARESARSQARYSREVYPSNAGVWGVTEDPAATHAELEERGMVLAAAVSALRLLSSSDREVIELCVIGSLTPSQAAAVLQEPPSTVRSRLTRARRRLRDCVDQLLRSEDVTR
ncbi:MAG: sigma-70 family RNA polymerase sigma factor [Jiangellales bacterium]